MLGKTSGEAGPSSLGLLTDTPTVVPPAGNAVAAAE